MVADWFVDQTRNNTYLIFSLRSFENDEEFQCGVSLAFRRDP